MKQARQRGKHLMARIDDRTREALAWLRFVLNPEAAMPVVTDWKALSAFAEKQSLVGICMPFQCAERLEKEQLFQWYGLCQRIEYRNKLLNKRTGQLFGMLEEAGFSCCLLKGQGNAMLYPNPLMRCAGDIDVWVDADDEAVFQYVKKLFPDVEASYKHIHFPVFEDASVDIHSVPLKFRCHAFEKRLREWIEQHKGEQFGNKIKLPDEEREVCVPTSRFNAIYQLGHMLIHLYDEGVGLRQVVDYFYVLKHLDISEEERSGLGNTLQSLGLLRFAQAIMWIECNVLGLSADRCFVTQDVRFGRKLVFDILEGGNFGYYSQRYKGRNGYYQRRFVNAWRVLMLLRIAPREGIARLLGKMGTGFRLLFKGLFNKCSHR